MLFEYQNISIYSNLDVASVSTDNSRARGKGFGGKTGVKE